MGKKSRSFNFLIELLIVIVFFTISAIVCVNIFYQADRKSSLAANTTDAALSVENIVESLKIDDKVLADAKATAQGYEFIYERYKIVIIKNDEIDSPKGKYLIYEISAYDNDEQQLLSIETTCFRGEAS